MDIRFKGNENHYDTKNLFPTIKTITCTFANIQKINNTTATSVHHASTRNVYAHGTQTD